MSRSHLLALHTAPDAGGNEEILEIRFDHAHFLSFDNFRLTFEVVHIVAIADYNNYMDIQQEINIRLMEELAALDIKLAIPTQNALFNESEFPPAKVVDEETVPAEGRFTHRLPGR